MRKSIALSLADFNPCNYNQTQLFSISPSIYNHGLSNLYENYSLKTTQRRKDVLFLLSIILGLNLYEENLSTFTLFNEKKSIEDIFNILIIIE